MPKLRSVKKLEPGKPVTVFREEFNYDTTAGTIAGFAKDRYTVTQKKSSDDQPSETLIITGQDDQPPFVFKEAAINNITVFKRKVPGLRTVFRYYPMK